MQFVLLDNFLLNSKDPIMELKLCHVTLWLILRFLFPFFHYTDPFKQRLILDVKLAAGEECI